MVSPAMSIVRWSQHISNSGLYRICFDTPQLGSYIQLRCLQWFEHVLRKPPTELTKHDGRYRLCDGIITELNLVKADVIALIIAVYGLHKWNRNCVDLCENLATDNDRQPFAIFASSMKPFHPEGDQRAPRFVLHHVPNMQTVR